MEEAPVSAIRPALDTIRELDDGRFLDKLAVQIHDAVSAVNAFNKKATINIALTIAPMTQQGLSEPVLTASVELSSKLPGPNPHQTIFFVDLDGNPTRNQARQREIGFSIAGAQKEGASA